MATVTFAGRIAQSFAKMGASRTYGSPRHLNDYMLKDIGLSADDLGLVRRTR